jgi:hypothetical protein
MYHLWVGRRPLVPLLLLGPDYYFLVHHPVNQDDRHLLVCAMASDFLVTWQFSQREQLFFVMDKTPSAQLENL